ncbi:endo alpha-1,4 polygalactosaminidase [Pseudorhodobacter sp. E13]|uniref:endo alpha-1,4 polygalactosaminidase n=1 Tax=Pseudorhodobacter sp. E13 TaxID=2487931 RepID=UPI000F8E342F|nr:endo alpha-1,4 polygalactosaminidase [Pseudorhodobacter sp. E13]RUS60557.1 endo alpha-1,4 polygalactosaminidase [Pseudorhodobacter sp. E13]
MSILLASLVLIEIGESFDVQYTEPYRLDRKVQTLVLDADEFGPETVLGLRAAGTKVMCYVSVGTLETYRADFDAFPAKAIGKGLPDWPEERYIDIRHKAILPLMEQRFQKCKDAGFEGISPDNMDVYANESGFDLSEADAVAYVTALAQMAHGMGLLIGHKNAPDLAGALSAQLDFVITESCWKWDFCDAYQSYTEAGKPIFDIEYTDDFPDFDAACLRAREVGISMILKARDLTGETYQSCR